MKFGNLFHLQGVKLISLTVSLGGVESLIEHPGSMTHGSEMFANTAEKPPLAPGLIRLSVGIENVDDLKADLKQALDKA